MICVEFAPVNTTGNYRSTKFVKYLKEFDITPIVITFPVAELLKSFPHAKEDISLINELPIDTIIYRIKPKDISKYYGNKLKNFITIFFDYKDKLAKVWRQELKKQIPNIINEHNPELIYVSLPPFSIGKLASEIASDFNLPLVVDMRDHWALWGVSPFASFFHFKLTKNEEKNIFNKASKIICATEVLKEDFISLHNEIDQNKFVTITNGFDYDLDLKKYNIDFQQKNKIKICFSGSFYYNPENRDNIFKKWYQKRINRWYQYVYRKEDWRYNSPYYFFKILNEIKSINFELFNKIEVHFIGNKPFWLQDMINEFELNEKCIHHGFVMKSEINKLYYEMDMFFVTTVKVYGGKDYMIGSKVFDFIKFSKPVLGIVCEGAMKNFIENSKIGITINPDDNNASKILSDLLTRIIEVNPNYDYLRNFHRRVLASKLANIFYDILKNNFY
ncbi:MAG: hypothetical protein KatS3mg002_1287 [Candidatus Woesearchaeota archaeon]|nr:MAG: hypothetical protein KatS3mg002_1287 [Candidatus Woesearchaeota archaeon]